MKFSPAKTQSTVPSKNDTIHQTRTNVVTDRVSPLVTVNPSVNHANPCTKSTSHSCKGVKSNPFPNFSCKRQIPNPKLIAPKIIFITATHVRNGFRCFTILSMLVRLTHLMRTMDQNISKKTKCMNAIRACLLHEVKWNVCSNSESRDRGKLQFSSQRWAGDNACGVPQKLIQSSVNIAILVL